MKTRFLILMLALFCGSATAQKNAPAYDISVSVTDAQTKEPIIMGTVQLNPLGQYAVTDVKGKASIKNVPVGTYTLTVTYVGYETYTTQVAINNKNLDLNIRMSEASLALKEVSVTAKQNAAGTSTASIIGRQAIDHLQASSLADIMQLVPGQEIVNTNLTSPTPLKLRTVGDVNDNTAIYGTTVVMDGMPISNNAQISTMGTNQATDLGTDLRTISADDIEEVEVVRGIPSAEYGDLTSGMVIVHSKAGVTPLQVKAKVNPKLINSSISKGENFGRAGIFNASFDYAQSWGDPREKIKSFHRYTGSLGWSYDITSKWNINTKFRYMFAKDWDGDDPDRKATGEETTNKNQTLSITHNGKIQIEKAFSRTVDYTIGLSFNRTDQKTYGDASMGGEKGIYPLITMRETGYYTIPYFTRADMYQTTGYRESHPGSLFAKVNNRFYVKSGKTRQTFKMGVEYHYDWNSGRGTYNEDETHPKQFNADGQRPRAYSDIPGLHQIAAYAEDQLVWTMNKVNRLRATFGLRFAAMQPFANVATTALSPRLNLSFSATKWLDIRAGIGLSSKSPGLNYLYPDKNYQDRPASDADPNTQTQAWHTQVYNVEFSKNLKNATTTKGELGFDIRLKNGKKLSILGYIDNTPNGFGNVSEFFTYSSNYYANAAMTGDPVRTDIVFMSKGQYGNTNHTRNTGVEMEMDFGTWKAIRTSFHLSGAYQETKMWSTSLVVDNPGSSYIPEFSNAHPKTSPFKVVYPNGVDNSFDKSRRFLTTLRTVTHIPELRMVASLTTQVIWYDWKRNYNMDKNPIGWIDTDCNYHEITEDMLSGYLGVDAQYYPTPPSGIENIGIYRLRTWAQNKNVESNPIVWNTVLRLTKEFGKFGGLSFYISNALFYEPYGKNRSYSLEMTQRNTNNFSFGAELFFNL